jgi:hypothetical protein
VQIECHGDSREEYELEERQGLSHGDNLSTRIRCRAVTSLRQVFRGDLSFVWYHRLSSCALDSDVTLYHCCLMTMFSLLWVVFVFGFVFRS